MTIRSHRHPGLFAFSLALPFAVMSACSSDDRPAPSSGAAGTDAVSMAGSGGAGAPAAGSPAAGAPAAGSPAAGAGGSIGVAGAPAAGAGGSAGGPAAGSGGAPAAGSGGTGAAGSSGGIGPAAGSGGTVAPGEGGVIDATRVIREGETFDGEGKRFTAGSALGNGSQEEGQDPLFRLEPGATLKNVVIGSPAADGVHCYGDATLENIVWEDIGEDALTIKESGTVTLNGGSASNGEDKVFQINAASTFKVSNFTAKKAGKFIRQNGDTTFKIDVEIDHCDIAQMDEAVFRTDSNTSTVKLTNTRYSQIGDELFVGVNPANITQSNNLEY